MIVTILPNRATTPQPYGLNVEGITGLDGNGDPIWKYGPGRRHQCRRLMQVPFVGFEGGCQLQLRPGRGHHGLPQP